MVSNARPGYFAGRTLKGLWHGYDRSSQTNQRRRLFQLMNDGRIDVPFALLRVLFP